jgi:hypothetical protein
MAVSISAALALWRAVRSASWCCQTLTPAIAAAIDSVARTIRKYGLMRRDAASADHSPAR